SALSFSAGEPASGRCRPKKRGSTMRPRRPTHRPAPSTLSSSHHFFRSAKAPSRRPASRPIASGRATGSPAISFPLQFVAGRVLEPQARSVDDTVIAVGSEHRLAVAIMIRLVDARAGLVLANLAIGRPIARVEEPGAPDDLDRPGAQEMDLP